MQEDIGLVMLEYGYCPTSSTCCKQSRRSAICVDIVHLASAVIRTRVACRRSLPSHVYQSVVHNDKIHELGGYPDSDWHDDARRLRCLPWLPFVMHTQLAPVCSLF